MDLLIVKTNKASHFVCLMPNVAIFKECYIIPYCCYRDR
jgi:hypothetical protein